VWLDFNTFAQMAETDYSLHTLANGIRLVHKRVSGTRLVHCGYIIRTGSRNDEAHAGIAHCLEHMVFKGTTKRKTIHILNHLEVVGGEMNAYTTKENTAIYATVQGTHFTRAVDILSDIVFNSTIPKIELEKEKKVIAEEIKMYLDTPEENIYDEFQEMVFDKHPLAHNILGTEETLNKIEQEDILNFISNWYQPQNLIFSVVGNISLKRCIYALEKYTAHLQFKATIKSKNPNTVLQYVAKNETKKTDFVQAYAIMGGPAYNETNENKWRLLLLNNLLGGPGLNSKLNLAIREKYGFTYQIESGYQAFSDNGMFHCYLGSEKKFIEKSKNLVIKELIKLRTQKMGILQLSRFKNQFCGQLVMADENRSGLMIHLGRSILTEGKAMGLNEILGKINAITASNILDTANEIFDLNNFSYLTYLPD
jgi:predicted Zn-dependent peptidase